MTQPSFESPNFHFLSGDDTALAAYAMQAERYVFDDPNTCFLKLRQFAELLARHVAARHGIETEEDNFSETIAILRRTRIVEREVVDWLDFLRLRGNEAAHEGLAGRQSALAALITAQRLALWFHRTFHDSTFDSGPFRPPPNPGNAEDELRAEIESLQDAAIRHEAELASSQWEIEELENVRAELERKATEYWEQLQSKEEELESRTARLESERNEHETKLQKLLDHAAHQSPEGLRELLKRSRDAARHVGFSEPLHPPIAQIRIQGPYPSTCCKAPVLLYDAFAGGIVRVVCTSCGTTGPFTLDEFNQLNLWINCPSCRKRVTRFKVKWHRRYAFQCLDCDWRCTLSSLLPTENEAIAADKKQ